MHDPAHHEGGPAGMEAARLAALRGHRVILAEASDRLGGKLVYASRTYAPNADVLRWLTTQIDKLGVESSCAGHRAIQQLPALCPASATAMV